MNARSHIFDVEVEGHQLEDVVSSLFHTVLFHRTLGKFHYKQETSYSVGTVGLCDVDCDSFDFTYIQCASEGLQKYVQNEIQTFSELVRSGEISSKGITGDKTQVGTGSIAVEFFQKRRQRWPFPAEPVPWEVWTVKANLITLNSEHERQMFREKVTEMLTEKVLFIAQTLNKHEYVPKMPNQSDLDLVFDTSFSDVQPYLFKIGYNSSGITESTVGTTLRRFLKDNLSI